jgi:hypothetical protein
MDRNGILIMALSLSIAACMIIGVISVLIVLYRNSKAVTDKHLCYFWQTGKGFYSMLLDKNGNQIDPPENHIQKHPHMGNYIIDDIHTSITRWPEGWPPFLQTKVSCSIFEEGCPSPIAPALRDPVTGKIVGVQSTITPRILRDYQKQKVGEELRGYGEREREITDAMRHYLKPVYFYIISGVLAILLIASIYLQWKGNSDASRFYSQYTISESETVRK